MSCKAVEHRRNFWLSVRLDYVGIKLLKRPLLDKFIIMKVNSSVSVSLLNSGGWKIGVVLTCECGETGQYISLRSEAGCCRRIPMVSSP